MNQYVYVQNNPLNYVDPTGHLSVEVLQGLSIAYNLGQIADGNLGAMVLVKNGLESAEGIKNVTVFHDIAQILAAKQVYKKFGKGQMLMPALETRLASGKEIDIMWNPQIWEVKPFGQSAEDQLNAYTKEGGYKRGDKLDARTNFHIYGQLYMSIYFTSLGVVNYSLLLKKDGNTRSVNVYVARDYANQEYAERSKKAGVAQAGVIAGVAAAAAAAAAAVEAAGAAIASGLKAIF